MHTAVLLFELERSATNIFLQRRDIPLPYSYAVPIRWMSHSGLILGERTIKPQTNICHESGYQPLRLATELVPATFAAIGPKIISPFWSILFYFVFIMFGLAQQVCRTITLNNLCAYPKKSWILINEISRDSGLATYRTFLRFLIPVMFRDVFQCWIILVFPRRWPFSRFEWLENFWISWESTDWRT